MTYKPTHFAALNSQIDETVLALCSNIAISEIKGQRCRAIPT